MHVLNAENQKYCFRCFSFLATLNLLYFAVLQELHNTPAPGLQELHNTPAPGLQELHNPHTPPGCRSIA